VRRRHLLAAAAGAVLARPALASAQDSDPAILDDLIAREEAAALAHRRAGSGIEAHETAHAMALRTQLGAFGRAAPAGPRDSAGLQGAARRLAEAGEGWLPAAIALEEELIRAYREAVVRLVEPSVLQTAATILAAHAQHRARLLAEAGRPPLG
jgi:Ferritin-like domain